MPAAVRIAVEKEHADWIVARPAARIVPPRCDRSDTIAAVIVAVVLAVVLVVGGAVAFTRLRAVEAERDAKEAERARLEAEGEALRARLAEVRREADELIPYRDAVDAAEDWLWAVDEEGRLRFSSAAGAALLGREELLGVPLAELTHPDDHAVGWSGVLRRQHADGSYRTVDSRSVRAGRGWQGIDRDLTAVPPAKTTPGVAVVRSPVVDGRREVVAYELIGDGDVLAGFRPRRCSSSAPAGPSGCRSTASSRRSSTARARCSSSRPEPRPSGRAELRAQGFALALDDFSGATELLEHCGIVKVGVAGREDDELRALVAEPAERGLELVATGVADRRRVHPLPAARLLALPGRVLRAPARRARRRPARSPRCRRSAS